MAHINQTFSDSVAGTLEVTLEGVFWVGGTGRDAGFPGGDSNLLIRGSLNGNKPPAIDRFAPSAKTSFAYPGGGVVWPVTTETVQTSTGGGTVNSGIRDLKMTLVLIKR